MDGASKIGEDQIFYCNQRGIDTWLEYNLVRLTLVR